MMKNIDWSVLRKNSIIFIITVLLSIGLFYGH